MPLCGALDPSTAFWGLHSLSQVSTALAIPGLSPPARLESVAPLPSKVLRGAPGASPSDPTEHLAWAVGQNCLPSLGIPQGSQLPQGTASSHLHIKEYTQESNL